MVTTGRHKCNYFYTLFQHFPITRMTEMISSTVVQKSWQTSVLFFFQYNEQLEARCIVMKLSYIKVNWSYGLVNKVEVAEMTLDFLLFI